MCRISQIELQEMQGTWLEEVRSNLEAIEVLQNAITSEMLAIQDNPKEKAVAEHRMLNFTAMLQGRAKAVTAFMREEEGLRQEEAAVIEGHKSLKSTEKKKPAEVIWTNFYERAKQLREQSKRGEASGQVQGRNTVGYYRERVFEAPFAEPRFSLEESKGKYVDMHTIYMEYLNLCKVMEEGGETTRLHDYLWFLQNMDKFDDFPINRKYKHQPKYTAYLTRLYDYLWDFIQRSRPLSDHAALQRSIDKAFEDKYSQGKLLGWDQHNEHIDDSKMEYCPYCRKLFITNEAFVSHLMGKKHLKLSKQEVENDPAEEEKARETFREEAEKRKRSLAFMEFRIGRLREELATTIYDTMNLVRKKQTRGYEEVDENEEESSESEEADAPIYNPKNLPLGWDGKPIPYWLYKLHGLGIEYKCEICGNYSYWGRRAFEQHFQEWRHSYGMKCLKIPNTIHFKDITTISDALALHEKLVRESKEGQFLPDAEEEFEDNEGNLLTKKTYLDMKKQGLIS